MFSLADLSLMLQKHPMPTNALSDFRIGARTFATDREPVIMGVVNLSRDSSYRDSIAPTPEAAIRKAKVLAAAGAHVIDLGAESTRGGADHVSSDKQIDQLVPVIRQLADAGVAISVESYSPDVVGACLAAGASVVNLTGVDPDESIMKLAAQHRASVVMCFVPGENVRDGSSFTIHDDPLPHLLEHFGPRVARARELGVASVAIDPGLGFFYGPHVEPWEKMQHQGQVVLQSYRLRSLGVPVCQIMPHAFDLFEDQFRTGEGFFTMWGFLGRVGVYRVHEVAHVRTVLAALQYLDPTQ